MDLFFKDFQTNILPFDGEVEYHVFALNQKECKFYFDVLTNSIQWKHDEAVIFGKHYVTARKVAWYGDSEFEYKYSGITKKAIIWTPELLELKNKIEKISNTTYNSCLLNLYHDGNEGMSWHSDDEKTLLENGTIASLSFGAERKFLFKHKETKQKVEIFLQNGSLLLMKGKTQKFWLHQLSKTKKVKKPRINLTFRTVII